jgi:hypothetical protein
MKPATLPPDEHLYEGSMDIHRRIVALYPKVRQENHGSDVVDEQRCVARQVEHTRAAGPQAVPRDAYSGSLRSNDHINLTIEHLE